MRTAVFIDGFNLYNLRLKRLPQFKWLNLRAMSERLAPAPNVITRVNYYTARVSARIDPGGPRRQQLYLDALASEPLVRVHYGRFLFSDKWAKLFTPPDARPPGYLWTQPPPVMVRIYKVEEKGSDVNLASHLIYDAMTNQFDQAFVISNDTDLVEPIRIVVQEVGKRVGIVAPRRARQGEPPVPSPSLAAVASFTLYLDNHHLVQFPSPLTLPDGRQITKPAGWV
jgi:uncharacterized LabA/DUF88 family protein